MIILELRERRRKRFATIANKAKDSLGPLSY
jgi:hypothetical protein